MKVAELQHFLANIVPFARAAGASEKVASELDRALQCMDPFKEKTLAEFSEFLRRADEFDRTGKLTAPASSAKARAAKAPALSIDDAAKIYTDLYARATEPTLTYADIDAKLKPIEKLTMPQLKELAGKVGVTVSAKTKKQLLDQLMGRIKELKASFERTQYRFGA
jgi:hypothetical protein